MKSLIIDLSNDLVFRAKRNLAIGQLLAWGRNEVAYQAITRSSEPRRPANHRSRVQRAGEGRHPGHPSGHVLVVCQRRVASPGGLPLPLAHHGVSRPSECRPGHPMPPDGILEHNN